LNQKILFSLHRFFVLPLVGIGIPMAEDGFFTNFSNYPSSSVSPQLLTQR